MCASVQVCDPIAQIREISRANAEPAIISASFLEECSPSLQPRSSKFLFCILSRVPPPTVPTVNEGRVSLNFSPSSLFSTPIWAILFSATHAASWPVAK